MSQAPNFDFRGPPPAPIPAEARIPAQRERELRQEQEREEAEEDDRVSYEPTPALPPVASVDAREPPAPAEDEEEPVESEPPGSEPADSESADSEPPQPAEDELPPEAATEPDAEPVVRAAPTSSPRWLPIVALLVVAVGVILFVRFRNRETQQVRPAETVAATISAPTPPRIPVLSTAEPVIDATLDDASVVDMEAAKTERIEAVRALEVHNLPKALDLATLATTHDPANAEGWLILGATHIYRGDYAASKKAFKSCVDVAKVGRRDECAALL